MSGLHRCSCKQKAGCAHGCCCIEILGCILGCYWENGKENVLIWGLYCRVRFGHLGIRRLQLMDSLTVVKIWFLRIAVFFGPVLQGMMEGLHTEFWD